MLALVLRAGKGFAIGRIEGQDLSLAGLWHAAGGKEHLLRRQLLTGIGGKALYIEAGFGQAPFEHFI
ncbi:hypothetical protein D3C85_1441150 [compost metagenome]